MLDENVVVWTLANYSWSDKRPRSKSNKRILTKYTTFFMLVDKFDDLAHEVVGLFHYRLQLSNCRELLDISDIKYHVRHGINDVYYFLVELVLCIQDLLEHQLEHLPEFLKMNMPYVPSLHQTVIQLKP